MLDERNFLSAGAAGDWSGFTNDPPDLIDVFLVSWNDTRIVLGGFGFGSWFTVFREPSFERRCFTNTIQTSSGFTPYRTVAS